MPKNNKNIFSTVCKFFMTFIYWILFSIPVITIGASTSAAFYTLLKLYNDEDIKVFSTFVKGFKTNWKQGSFLLLITAALSYIFYITMHYIIATPDCSSFIIALCIAVLVFIFFILLYAFPLSAHYENKFYIQLLNSFVISIKYFKRTILPLIIFIAEICLLLWNKKTIIAIAFAAPLFYFLTISISSHKIFFEIDEQNKKNALEEKEKSKESNDIDNK